MTRIDIDIPDRFDFATELPVMIGHINSGNHLANENLVALLNEARVRFLAERRFNELHPREGLLVVNADLAVSYRSEAHYGETLRIEVGVTGFQRVSYGLVYRVSCRDDQRLVALARTGHVVIDLQTRRAVDIPPEFRRALDPSASR